MFKKILVKWVFVLLFIVWFWNYMFERKIDCLIIGYKNVKFGDIVLR